MVVLKWPVANKQFFIFFSFAVFSFSSACQPNVSFLTCFQIFDVDEMIKPKLKAQSEKMINDVREEALEKAIARVTAILQQEKLAAEQARIEEKGTKESLKTILARQHFEIKIYILFQH